MPIKLIRRPRSGASQYKVIQTEVRKTLIDLSDKLKARLYNDIKDWSAENTPKFIVKYSLTKSSWSVEARLPKRGKAAKIYNWVDHGTGSRGGGEDYIIMPKKPDGVLKFTTPHHPKSLPNPRIPGFPRNDPPKSHRRVFVIHPGIYPRNFSKTISEEYAGRKSGSFKAIIDAAVKRGIRKLNKDKT